MTDRDFELLLEEEITALPPGDELVADITPWRAAMNRILVGLGLATITVNLLALDTILPATGMVMMLLGFRALRRENRWFALGYWMSILRTAYFLVWLFLEATIYHAEAAATPLAEISVYGIVAVDLLRVLGLALGIRAVRKKAGSDAYAGGTGWLVVLYVIMAVLGYWNYSGFFVWIIFIVYFLTLRTLWDLSKALDEAGYTVAAAPVRVSDPTVKKAYTLITLVLLAVGYLFFGRYPMDWQEIHPQSQTEVRARLEALDFPGYVLDDLTEEEILGCAGAKDVYVETEEIAFNDGVLVTESNGYETYSHWEYPVKELLVTHVAIRPVDSSDPWTVIHHFQWRNMPFFRGTEAIQIWPAYMQNDGWNQGTHMSGRVLYDRDGVTYAAPYYSLEEISYTAAGFFGAYENTDLAAAYSMPARGENCRGYVYYDLEMVEEGWLLNSWFNYCRQTRPIYPVQTAAGFSRSGFSIGRTDFLRRQSELQLWWDEIEAPYDPEE